MTALNFIIMKKFSPKKTVSDICPCSPVQPTASDCLAPLVPVKGRATEEGGSREAGSLAVALAREY